MAKIKRQKAPKGWKMEPIRFKESLHSGYRKTSKRHKKGR